MTARERIMIYVLGALALGGLGYLAFTMLVRPIRAQNAQIDTLKDQILDKELQLDRDRNDNLRLQKLVPLTLPGNRELAESEYETLLGRLLRDSKISGGKYSKQSQSDSDPEPELVAGTPGKPGKKAYTKVIYSISFDKVTLSKLTTFLQLYAKVPILHQIVKCSVKHVTSSANAGKIPKADERNDLTVNLVSEAVLLDGAPERRTLFAVPDSFGAAFGGVALFGLRNDTEKARYLTPTPDAAYFAATELKRDYELLAARDPFHGPLPEYPPYVKPPAPPAGGGEKPIPPPYDSSPFVYLSSLVQTTQGGKMAAQADMFDRYYNQLYTVQFEQFGELFEVKVERFTKELKVDAKTKEVTTEVKADRLHPRGSTMELADRANKLIRTFKVYGLNGNALILGERAKVDPPKDEKAKVGGGRPVKGAKPPAVALPKPDPAMGAVGGFGAIKSTAEKVYWWEVGQPLSQMRLLSEKDAKAAVEAAKKGLGVPALPPPPLTRLIEEAPFPRLQLN